MQTNELAPEGVLEPPGLCFVFDLYIYYSGLSVTNMKLNLVSFVWLRWFWGLTCDFWAENAENNSEAKTTAIESVASPFEPHSGFGEVVAASRPASMLG